VNEKSARLTCCGCTVSLSAIRNGLLDEAVGDTKENRNLANGAPLGAQTANFGGIYGNRHLFLGAGVPEASSSLERGDRLRKTPKVCDATVPNASRGLSERPRSTFCGGAKPRPYVRARASVSKGS